MKKTIGYVVVIALCIGGLIGEYLYLNRRNSPENREIIPPPTKQTGTLISVSGEFKLYMHNTLERYNNTKLRYILREGNRLQTSKDASAIFDGCIYPPDFNNPVRFFLREESSIGIMKSPAIDIEKGSFIASVPSNSMGLNVVMKLPDNPNWAQCLANDADLLVSRDNNRLYVCVYRGKARLWNAKGEIIINENHEGSIIPDEAPDEAKPVISIELPKELLENKGK